MCVTDSFSHRSCRTLAGTWIRWTGCLVSTGTTLMTKQKPWPWWDLISIITNVSVIQLSVDTATIGFESGHSLTLWVYTIIKAECVCEFDGGTVSPHHHPAEGEPGGVHRPAAVPEAEEDQRRGEECFRLHPTHQRPGAARLWLRY